MLRAAVGVLTRRLALRHLASLTPRHTDVLGERRLSARRPPSQRTTIDTAGHHRPQ